MFSFFISYFVFRKQSAYFFFSPEKFQPKAVQINKCGITKTCGFVQVCFQILNIIKKLHSILLFSALMVVTASSLLPEDFREPLSIVKDSIMYSDNCEQFVCWRNMSLLLKMNSYKMYRKFETIKCNYQQIKSNQIRRKLGSNLEIITKQALSTYS